MIRTRVLAAIAVLGFALSACGDNGADQRLSVFAASSLTNVLTDIVVEFESANPGVIVDLNFAGSPTIREQLREGAQADVVMVASEAVMGDLMAEGLVSNPVIAASNEMVVVVPDDNPGSVRTLMDLADESLLVGLCDANVPCGETALNILRAAGVEVSPDTNESDVRSLLAKVASGELDAGIVYASDVVGSNPPVGFFAINRQLYDPNSYPIAVTSTSRDQPMAQLFVDYVLSEPGQQVFAHYGFIPMVENDS